MKVGLINSPVERTTKHSKLNLPLGLAYLGSYLMENDHSVHAMDMNISGLSMQRIERMVNKDIDVVGISSQTETFPNALKIAKKIKSLNEDIKIVFGGPHPTLRPKEALKKDFIDFVVLGEGEKTFLDLIKYLNNSEKDLSDIQGLAYKKNNEIHLNNKSEPIDLDELPFPARRLFPIQFYEQPWTILTSRGGCPFKCPFCSVSEIWEDGKRQRKPHKVINEVNLLLEKEDTEYVFFVDDILTFDKAWTYELLNEIKKLNKSFKWGCSTRVDLVNEELLGEMVDAGCCSIQFGMETGSQQILDEIKDGLDKKEAFRKISFALELGIDVACTFMFPHPFDTKETLEKTKKFMKKLSTEGAKILLSCTTPFPGTKYRKNAEEYGINILTNDWSKYDAKHITMETNNFSRNQLNNLLSNISKEVELKST